MGFNRLKPIFSTGKALEKCWKKKKVFPGNYIFSFIFPVFFQHFSSHFSSYLLPYSCLKHWKYIKVEKWK